MRTYQPFSFHCQHRSLPIQSSFEMTPTCARRSNLASSARPPSSRPSHERPQHTLVQLLLLRLRVCRVTNPTTATASRRRSWTALLRHLLRLRELLSLFFLVMSTIDPSSRSRRMSYDRRVLPSPCPSSKLKRMLLPVQLLLPAS